MIAMDALEAVIVSDEDIPIAVDSNPRTRSMETFFWTKEL
jgi:hypothetical protein